MSIVVIVPVVSGSSHFPTNMLGLCWTGACVAGGAVAASAGGTGEDTRCKVSVPESPLLFDQLVFRLFALAEVVVKVTETPVDWTA